MISVALCTYNGEKYLEEQIQSILNQSLPVDEIVVCDDGSTDSTLNILNIIAKQSSIKFTIIENEQRLNVVKNFEKAISKCEGDYIFLSDQDDIWHKNKVEVVLNYFNKNSHINVVFTDGLLIDENNKLLENKSIFKAVSFQSESQLYFNKGYAFELLNYFNRVVGATLACRGNYLRSILPFKVFENIFHDEMIALNAINDNCLGYINECLIKYRIHTDQTIGLKTWINYPIKNIYLAYHFIRNEYFDFLNFNPNLKQRVDFIKKRGKNIKTLFGIVHITFNWRNYKNIYRDLALEVFRSDYKNYFQLNRRRIKRYIKI